MASPSAIISSEPMPPDPTTRILEGYARVLVAAGPLLVLGVVAADRQWADHPGMLAAVLVAVALLRAGPVRLSKFSYLTQTAVPALVAALAAPPSVGILGLVGGVLVADLGWLRKPVRAGAAPPAAPPPVGFLGRGGGVRGAAREWFRKPVRAGAVNAGREALAFAVAY